MRVLVAFAAFLLSLFRSRLDLQIEILALRHQLAAFQQAGGRPRIRASDRLLWKLLATLWSRWQQALVFVQPATIIAWQRRRFRDHWRRLSRRTSPGRPVVDGEIRDLIRRMCAANPTWGSPRILGELRKIGIDVAKSTVERYMRRPKRPPSPTWRAFLKNHIHDMAAVDFFVVPTVTFKILFVFVVLAHNRRRVVHFNVTANPTAF